LRDPPLTGFCGCELSATGKKQKNADKLFIHPNYTWWYDTILSILLLGLTSTNHLPTRTNLQKVMEEEELNTSYIYLLDSKALLNCTLLEFCSPKAADQND
jgi:hypothetical protein